MPHAKLSGVDLYYEQAGDEGPPLLFVNGTASDLRNKPSALSWPIMAGFAAIAYDHRGLGQSVDHREEPPSMATFADDALSLLEHLGVDEFVLMGISFGGMVAQEIALRATNRLRALVLLCTSSGGAGGSSYPLHELYRLPEKDRERPMRLVSDRRYGDNAEVRSFYDLIATNRRPTVTDRGLLRQLEARRHHDTWERLGGIATPTFIGAGRYDDIAPIANSVALASRIEHSTLHAYEGGHLFLFQDRHAFRDVGSFLSTFKS